MSTNEKLDYILEKLDKLEEKIIKIENDSEKMSHHILFISSLYEKYKNGLDFVHTFFTRCK